MGDFEQGRADADHGLDLLQHAQRSVKLLRALCERLRVPVDCRELAEVVASEHGNVHRSGELNAAAVLRLLERCDALLACECDAHGRLGMEEAPYPQRERLQRALALAQIDTSAIASNGAARGLDGPQIGAAIGAARVQAIAEGLNAAA